MALVCSTVNSPQELEELRHFRYQVYVEELGKRLSIADHGQRVLLDPFDAGAEHFICRFNGRIVGTTRLHVGSAVPELALAHTGMDAVVERVSGPVAYMSKLMVATGLRGGSTLLQLLAQSYQRARDHGVTVGFSHCAPHLVPFYLKLGLRAFSAPFEDNDVGTQVPLALVLEDEGHLASSGSALLSLARQYRNDINRAAAMNELLFKNAHPLEIS